MGKANSPSQLERLREKESRLVRAIACSSEEMATTRKADSSEKAVNAELVDVQSRELVEVRDAIHRIEQGIQQKACEVCGKNISKERIANLPHATLCVACKRDEEHYGSIGSNHEPEDWGRAAREEQRQKKYEEGPSSDDIPYGFSEVA